MDYRLKLVVVVFLSFIIALSGGFLTEYIRQSMTFSWAVEVGDEFVYDVSVVGNSTTPSQTLPPPFEPMNNTRVIVEIISLPNLTLYFYGAPFIQDVVEHAKTTVRFEDGTDIPAIFYYAMNTHASWSILPIGAWGHLDSLFPNQINKAVREQDSYISIHRGDSFFFGYWLNQTYSTSEWHASLDLTTGIPTMFSFSVYTVGTPWTHSYVVTMTLVT